ncbi:glycosyltransferase family 4 protein [Desulfoplanes formicivorans]|uniref:Undecaprenyl-phosphate alpha-N-acetylglucosaminyl 1-phosphate transferase n=1 Tax=Desulfoplanes formicivorans TaxID=1592317 RepID=A0A194AJ87_9BACT|nr:MraY family glycosyltransferase [Desulfoplanes formicivorans]GAU09126.1 undecaprenyl-phosphate alpha-N-acetylglucosaminyl 1-phosphate transferase [Desulfoplanes formicivorans]
MNYLIAFYLEFFVVTLLMPFAIKAAYRMGIVDLPGYRKVHSNPIPRIGGVVIAISVLLVFCFISSKSLFLYVFMVSGSLIVIAGLIDDCVCLNYRYKFIAQAVASCFFVVASGMHIPFLETLFGFEGPLSVYADIFITSVFIIGAINIINLSDGLDALASGLAIISFFVIIFIAYESQRSDILSIAILMISSMLAFMRFNVFPAQIFMGDTGSQFIGFTLGACIVVLSCTNNFTVLNIGIIPFLLGIPFLDTLNVIYLRLLERKNPFLPDKNHIHHKLVAMHLTQYQAVGCMYVAHFVLLGFGLAMRGLEPLFIIFIYILFAFLSLFGLNRINFSGVLNFFSKIHHLSVFQIRIGQSSITLSRYSISRFFWHLFFAFLSCYYVFFSATMTTIDVSLLSVFVVVLLLSLFLCIVCKYDYIVFYKIMFYFFNMVILIYSNDHYLFEMNNGLISISLIDVFIISIFFLYFVCISLTSEKVPVNSIDFLMLIGLFLLIFVSAYESSMLYFLQMLLRFVLMSFFINLIFSRFERNMKYVTVLMIYLFFVFIVKAIAA